MEVPERTAEEVSEETPQLVIADPGAKISRQTPRLEK